ncbi:hypothetical protein pb186bvf_015305 [Paramecium bursaria]
MEPQFHSKSSVIIRIDFNCQFINYLSIHILQSFQLSIFLFLFVWIHILEFLIILSIDLHDMEKINNLENNNPIYEKKEFLYQKTQQINIQ